VVSRDDVFPPEGQLVMVVSVSVFVPVRGMIGMRFGSEARGCVHSGN
jgi:hypothetical protein